VIEYLNPKALKVYVSVTNRRILALALPMPDHPIRIILRATFSDAATVYTGVLVDVLGQLSGEPCAALSMANIKKINLRRYTP